MESRAAFRGAESSKWLTTVFAVIVAMCLGVMLGYLVHPISGPAATQTTTQTGSGGEAVDSFDGHGHGLLP
jgi:hypothetical protein